MKKLLIDLDKLRVPAEPLKFITDTGMTKEEGEKIIAEIKEVMENDKNIVALTAPQIGINKRVFCIRFGDGIKTFINPIVTKKEGCVIAPELFLSMPDKEFLIARPKEVRTVYYTDEFKYEDNKLLDTAARVFDQCTNVLDGVLPDKLGLVSTPKEDGSLFDATEDEMKEYIEIYKKFVAAKSKQLKDEVNASDKDKETFRELKFTEDVVNGRAKVMANPDDPNRKMNRAERRAYKKQLKALKRKKAGK